MSSNESCPGCSRAIEASWQVCPFCTTYLHDIDSVFESSANLSPIATDFSKESKGPAPPPRVERESNRDMRITALVLLGAAALGVLGWIGVALQRLEWDVSPEVMMYSAVGLVFLTLVGVIIYTSSARDAQEGVAVGVLGAMTTVLLAFAMGVLLVLYMISSCLTDCANANNPGRFRTMLDFVEPLFPQGLAMTSLGLLISATVIAKHVQGKLPAKRVVGFQKWLALVFAMMVGGMLGAWLPSVWSWATANLTETEFARTLTTGLVGAYVFALVATRAMRLERTVLDQLSWQMAGAVVLLRLHCLWNGCCYGSLTALPWGIDFVGDGPRHPVQIYEIAFHAMMALALCYFAREGWFAEHCLKLYLILYCVFRFATEWIRPAPIGLLGLTDFQWIVAVFGALLCIQWWRETHRMREPQHFNSPHPLPGRTIATADPR